MDDTKDIKSGEAGDSWSLTPISKHKAEILDDLFSRPLWRRSWVIQEVVLATKVKLHCGPCSLDWDSISTIENTDHNRRSLHITSTEHETRRRESYKSYLGGPAAALQRLRREHRSGIRLELEDILLLTRSHYCTAPQDKIFSILSLLSEADATNDLLQVDYTVSWTEVFRLAAAFILMKSQTLNLLSLATRSDIAPRLPSWIPNWTDLKFPHLEAKLYKADGGCPINTPIAFLGDGSSLAVDGIILDFLQAVDEDLIGTFTNEGLQAGVDRIDSGRIQQIPRGQTKTEVCWRTVLADHLLDANGNPHRISVERFDGLQSWNHLGEKQDFQTLAHFEGQRIVFALKGYIGFAASHVRIGDMVVILFGGRVPFVVRKTGHRFAERILCNLIGPW